MIMVALTSNLVMYTLYSGILEKLPDDSSLKLIDIWLLHGLLMPMVVFITLATNELLKIKLPNETKHFASIKSPALSDYWVKIGTKTVKVVPENVPMAKEEGSWEKKRKSCMLVCKVIMPTFSIIFIVVYFAVCLSD